MHTSNNIHLSEDTGQRLVTGVQSFDRDEATSGSAFHILEVSAVSVRGNAETKFFLADQPEVLEQVAAELHKAAELLTARAEAERCRRALFNAAKSNG